MILLLIGKSHNATSLGISGLQRFYSPSLTTYDRDIIITIIYIIITSLSYIYFTCIYYNITLCIYIYVIIMGILY
jgi:hypothetical protein